MQADAYADRFYAAGRQPGPIVEAACWAHARGKFFDLARLNRAPSAIEAVARIDPRAAHVAKRYDPTRLSAWAKRD
jgi:transposase